MDQQVLDAIQELAKKIVVEKTVTEQEIKAGLAHAIDMLTNHHHDEDATIDIVINDCHGGFSYSNPFISWMNSRSPETFTDLSDMIDTDLSRQAAATIMVDFGKYMLAVHNLQPAVSSMVNYLTLLDPLPAWLRGEDITPYIQLLTVDRDSQSELYHEIVSKLHSWCQINLDKILLSIKTLAGLIGVDQLQPCFVNYAAITSLPHGFSLYIFQTYIKPQQSTAASSDSTTAITSSETKSSIVPDSVYQQFGLHFASGKHCRLKLVKVKRYRHWTINEYDGKEYIEY